MADRGEIVIGKRDVNPSLPSHVPGVPKLSRGFAFHGVGGYGW